MPADKKLIWDPSSRISDRSQANRPMTRAVEANQVTSRALMMSAVSMPGVIAAPRDPGSGTSKPALSAENSRFTWFRKKTRPRIAVQAI